MYLIRFQKLKLKILSLQKLIEQLRAEIKEKADTITELEEKLKAQVNIYHKTVLLQLNLTSIMRHTVLKISGCPVAQDN